MRTMLFYRVSHLNGASVLEFRRAQHGRVTAFLPPPINAPVALAAGADPHAAAIRLTQASKWVGEPPRAADSDVGEAVLRGQW